MAKKKLNSVIGVDIGSQNIKVAEIKNLGREYAVSAVGLVPTPSGMVDHTGVYDTDSIGAMVKQICQSAGCTVNQLVMSIAGQASVLVRTLEVPRMNPNELKDHMSWEISRNMPFAESTIQSDYKTFPVNDPSATNMDVVMAIAPQSAVDTLMGIAKKAAKQVHALDVEPLGLARLVSANYAHEANNQTVCVIEMGAKTTAINVYKDGQLLFLRQVPVGGETFTNAISSGLGLSADEAESLKLSRGRIPESAGRPSPSIGAFGATQDLTAYNPFAPAPDANPFMEAAPAEPMYETPTPQPYGEDQAYGEPQAYVEPAVPTYDAPNYGTSPYESDPAPVSAAPEPVSTEDPEVMRIYNAMAGEIDEFVAEIRRSIDYFRSKGGDVHRIYTAGGGAQLEGLNELIAKSVGLEVEMLDPFKGMQITAKKIEHGMLEEHRPQFAVAVGNGLHIVFD